MNGESSPPALSLGEISPDRFLAEYWQKKPLLIRNAGQPPDLVDKSTFLDACTSDDADSRLITGDGQSCPWHLTHGPLDPNDIPPDDSSPWTVLLRHAETWQPALTGLQQSLSFIPAWRHQDVMISYASPGGSVGPHNDRYDVFLFQGSGCRNWAIDEDTDLSKIEWQQHDELRLINNFGETSNFFVEPGDLLYLPPGIPHWGVAMTPCFTYSLGFRTPTASELLWSLATVLSEGGIDPAYADPDLASDEMGTVISSKASNRAADLIGALTTDEKLLSKAIALWASEPIGAQSEDDEDSGPDTWWRASGARLTLTSDGTLFANGAMITAASSAPELALTIASDRNWVGHKDTWTDDEQNLLDELAEIGALIDPE